MIVEHQGHQINLLRQLRTNGILKGPGESNDRRGRDAGLGEGYAGLELNALVQRVVVTDHPRQAAEELAGRWTQLSPDEILQSPYVLIGTVDKLIEDLHARRESWGISYYVIFEPYVDAFAPVVARLAGD